MVKNPSAMQETRVWSLGGEDPLEKEMAAYSSILSWKSHGQRSLVGYSPRGHERDGHNLVTKQKQHLKVTISFISQRVLVVSEYSRKSLNIFSSLHIHSRRHGAMNNLVYSGRPNMPQRWVVSRELRPCNCGHLQQWLPLVGCNRKPWKW